ncbi:hypothetical protein BkAM31D_09705 [Halalkalibacter krulwichiae]|uniref:Uncharacterized protein n=1 Tax=Halalkalibacter krulwichiae TaxID=199441 RepID=A0A1X9M9M2_9BACI|nr:hypothetical protein BkAM31D_09705 [Halalkalibacter krulwichiae]
MSKSIYLKKKVPILFYFNRTGDYELESINIEADNSSVVRWRDLRRTSTYKNTVEKAKLTISALPFLARFYISIMIQYKELTLNFDIQL